MFKLHSHKQSGAARPLLIRNLLFGSMSVLLLGMHVFAMRSVDWQNAFASQKSEPQTHTVLIKDFKYVPETLTVKSGDTVIWKNEDIVPHTATANGKSFDSKNIAAKASWKYVAGKPGNYPYICTYHPTMKAKLIVK